MSQLDPLQLRDMAVDLSSTPTSNDLDFVQGYLRGGAVALMLIADCLDQVDGDVFGIEAHFCELARNRNLQKRLQHSEW